MLFAGLFFNGGCVGSGADRLWCVSKNRQSWQVIRGVVGGHCVFALAVRAHRLLRFGGDFQQ